MLHEYECALYSAERVLVQHSCYTVVSSWPPRSPPPRDRRRSGDTGDKPASKIVNILRTLPKHNRMSLRERSARPGSPADWRDVTSLFSEAADAMETGQLVHVASFDLFRTMSALDIGDPQTDSGCSCHL